MLTMQSFGMTKMLNATFDEALARVPEALKTEGFGVLTEIDVADTLKKKLGVEFRKYRILGACNPPFAHRALQAHLEVGLFLPCNVVVYENDEGKAVVSAVDPMQTMAVRAGADMQELAAAVREKLSRVLDRPE
jgi:uncharacterized protein (DUF302 family)